MVLVLATISSVSAQDPFWTPAQVIKINSLSVNSLQGLRPDPSDRSADDLRAAELGQKFFSDARFSANGQVSCSSCLMPDRQFEDDLKMGHGMDDGTRRTMPIAGTAYHPFFFWDGRKDSQWSQALGPLENPAEHGADRTMLMQQIAANYRMEYESVFGPFPDLGPLPVHAAPAGSPETVSAWQKLTPETQRSVNRVFANIGKAIEAFERTVGPPLTRLDAYAADLTAQDDVTANRIFTLQERDGLKLFLEQGDCVRCHGGPQLTDRQFHNLGLPGTSLDSDSGRSTAAYTLKEDPFNCLGEFSDVTNEVGACFDLIVLRTDLPTQIGAFASPSLRGVAQRPPYVHAGQFAALHDVLVHYNNAPKATFCTSDLDHPPKLTEVQLSEIEAFLHTLDVDTSIH